MNKTIPTIITVSVLALALGACTPEQRLNGKHVGSYDSSETSTDAYGTKTVKESTTVVTEDEYGNKKETITSKTTRDPQGLGNKTTKKSSKTIEQK